MSTAAQPQAMPSLAFTCLDCGHPECLRKRAQSAIPCSRCGERIHPGQLFHVVGEYQGIVVEQVHAACERGAR